MERPPKDRLARGPRLACRVGMLTLSAAGLALAGPPADPRPASAVAAADSPEVDAATKKLMAAHGLFQRGLFKLAGQEYAEFLAAYPKHAEVTTARYALAICHYRLGEYAKAGPLLSALIQSPAFEQRDEALAVLGHCELADKQYDKAVAAFDELLARHPASKHAETASLNRGQALYLSGKFAESAEACRAFLTKYPAGAGRPAAQYFLALSQRGLGKNEDVVGTLEQLAQESPHSRYKTDAALLAGQALDALGKSDAALDQYRRMLSEAPETRKADARYALGAALYKAGQYDAAIRELTAVAGEGQAAATASPLARPARLYLGLARLAAGKTADARATLDAVAQDDPARAADARYGLAQCDLAEKKFESARAILGELLNLRPPPANAPRIALDRAVCLMEEGKTEEAAGELEAVAGSFPKSPQAGEAMYRRAYCLHKLGHYDQSHAACQQLSRRASDHSESEFALPAAELDAENLFLLAQYPEAAQAFQSLVQQAKERSTVPAGPKAEGRSEAKAAEDRLLRFELRIAQCAYYASDYARAAELLGPLSADPRVARTAALQVAIFLHGDSLLQQGKNAEAADVLGRYAAMAKGDKDETHFKLGLAQLRAGDKGAARKTWAGLSAGPVDSPWVQRGLVEYGQLLYKSGQGEPAAAALNKVLAGPASPELLAPAVYLLGWIDFDAKRFAEAADRFKEVAAKYPGHALAADAAFQRGVALKEAGRADEAAEALQAYAAAHADAPNAAAAWQMAAACLSSRGKHEQATALLASLATTPKASDTVLYDLAWSQRAAQALPAAVGTYRRLIQERPDSKLIAAARTELAELLYADGKYAEAAELLEPIVPAPPAEKPAAPAGQPPPTPIDPKVLVAAEYRLGWCYQKLNKPDKAGLVFAAFAARHADDDLAPSALLQAGLSFAEQGRLDQSERSLAGLLKKYPKFDQVPVAMLKLGEVQAEQGEYEASAATHGAFLQKFPKDPFAYRAHFGIGWSLENRKKYDEARAEYQKVIAGHNGETAARAQFQIGETLLAEGKFEPALAALLAVEDVYAYPAWSARALLESGRAFEELKQPDRARQQYTQLASKYKEAPEAAMAEARLKAMKP